MKLNTEFGFDHNPDIFSTFVQPALELMGLSVTYWLTYNSPLHSTSCPWLVPLLKQVISNLPMASRKNYGH